MSTAPSILPPYLYITPNKAEIVTVDVHLHSEQNPLDYQRFEQIGKSNLRAKQLACSESIVHKRINTDCSISRDSFGKPFLTSAESHISISHTENVLCLIHHPQTEVSLDIERYDRNIERVIPRFTNEKELTIFKNLGLVNPGIIVWSIKEALFKILGKQAVHFKTDLKILSAEKTDQNLKSFTLIRHQDLELQYEVNSLIFEPIILTYIDKEPIS